jgi:glycosyltransferase involved in cell wall biosynthesis
MGCICFFNTAVAWGGGEKWHFETSSYLHQKGYEVLVFAHPKSALLKKLKETSIPNIPITISNLSFLNPFKRNRLKKELHKHHIDTIVMNLSRDVKIAGPCAKSAGVKRIIYRRGSAIPIKNTFLNRHYFKNVLTDVLANSDATKKTVLENNFSLFPKEKIRVIYNGISIPNESSDDRPKTGNSQVFTLINLGRLEAQKNQSFLIDLAKELKERNMSFKLIIGGDGRLKTTLKNKINELKVNDVVELAGFIESPFDFMKKGDVFVLPSLWEGFGYVLAEAAISKKPIIAFNTSSNPELVINGETGLLVAQNNLKGFANAVEKLYRNSKMVMAMGERGAQHIKSNFDKKINLKKIETYLVNG